jgi:hypothetical protein
VGRVEGTVTLLLSTSFSRLMSRGAEGADEHIEKPPHTEHGSARTAMLQYIISVKYYSPDFHLDVERVPIARSLCCAILSPFFERFFIFSGPRGTR